MHIHQDYSKFGPKERVGFSLCFVHCKRGGPETHACPLASDSLLIPKPLEAFSKNDLSLYYLEITHVILFVKLKETVTCFLQIFIWILKWIFFTMFTCLWSLLFQGIPANALTGSERTLFQQTCWNTILCLSFYNYYSYYRSLQRCQSGYEPYHGRSNYSDKNCTRNLLLCITLSVTCMALPHGGRSQLLL